MIFKDSKLTLLGQMLHNKTLIGTILFVLLINIGCQSNHHAIDETEYPRWVGDISFNPELDDVNFEICNGEDRILQYFNLEQGPVYKSEKPNIEEIFQQAYKPISSEKQNGLIRIRFIVNCNGKADRFRVIQSDFEYNEFTFDQDIVKQLKDITTSIESWEILYRNAKPVDYYMYLIFKIEEGKLIHILP